MYQPASLIKVILSNAFHVFNVGLVLASYEFSLQKLPDSKPEGSGYKSPIPAAKEREWMEFGIGVKQIHIINQAAGFIKWQSHGHAMPKWLSAGFETG
jgi:hypothetical protein